MYSIEGKVDFRNAQMTAQQWLREPDVPRLVPTVLTVLFEESIRCGAVYIENREAVIAGRQSGGRGGGEVNRAAAGRHGASTDGLLLDPWCFARRLRPLCRRRRSCGSRAAVAGAVAVCEVKVGAVRAVAGGEVNAGVHGGGHLLATLNSYPAGSAFYRLCSVRKLRSVNNTACQLHGARL